jgi:hypothetical protein
MGRWLIRMGWPSPTDPRYVEHRRWINELSKAPPPLQGDRAHWASKEKDAAADFDLGEDFRKTIWSLGLTFSVPTAKQNMRMRGPPSGNLNPGRTSRTVPAKGPNISHGSRKTAEGPRDDRWE